MKKSYRIFDELSKRVGADMDKIIFEKDEAEIKKLERNMRKETMKERTRLIEQENKKYLKTD